ncbi:HypC/HybG/HupF family hydrogenase formation chaperone [Roseospira marina]|uniref:Hydrogenase maturation factor HypC n=1 Tax=Roseospira marina TaxID=140057 RepID=A0A5M6IDB9_9PROT|nr:HypC/HybG/HupF family hydrogenase formation chaperone [Roseospira marina]KAA5606271.1 HypC/HybG/HupF family hydrogenase formation chaperone [Roseospira marina]MBB4314428.1 hydrogenase expression/formation protein HypC [Roseospira marina]MBB5087588.1 hydrogenase expression/formation protein HypC [Roseospira marina]
MCLAVPARVLDLLPDAMARVDIGGVGKTISVALVEDLSVGDYVILHVGYALARLDPEEAETTLALIRDMAALAATDTTNTPDPAGPAS